MGNPTAAHRPRISRPVPIPRPLPDAIHAANITSAPETTCGYRESIGGNLTRSSAYTSAMFSETRYALNGDLRVAYRASREGPRDIVFVPNWFTCCELLPELPSIQGWVEAMTSLGRLIFFDQPGTGASDPVTAGRAAESGAMGRQHHRGTRRSRESRSGPRRVGRRVRDSGAVRGDTSVPHHRAGRVRGLRGSGGTATRSRRNQAAMVAMWGTGEFQHLVNPDMPWNEEIRAAGHGMNAWRPVQRPLLT